MRNLILSLAIVAIFSLTVHAQLPSIAAQNSLSYTPATATAPYDKVASARGLVTFYPTGGPTFAINQTGAVTQTGSAAGMDGKTYEAPDGLSTATVRVVYTFNNWTTRRYAGYITYMSSTQINFVAQGTANDTSPDYGGSLDIDGTFAFRVERRACQTNCPWAAISNPVNINFSRVAPHSAVYYNGAGGPWIVGDMYCSLDGQYIKGTTSGPNPRLYNGTNPASAYHPGTHANAQTVLVIYGTGAQSFSPATVCFYDIKYNGNTPIDYFVGYFNTAFFGVFQFNSNVPSTLNSATPIQLGAGYQLFGGPCNLGYNYGNTAYLENVQ